jgi:hypothetical protein
MIQPSVIHLQAYIADKVIGAVCILGSQYVYINKIHKIWEVSLLRTKVCIMYFINVNILGSQYVYINKIHKIWKVSLLRTNVRIMNFINVYILGSQCAHSTNGLVCYVGLKKTD